MLWNGGESVARAAAADLDAHLVGPPTAGPLSVAKLNALDYWAARVGIIDKIVTFTGPVGTIPIGAELPTGSLVISCQANLQTIITLGGGAARMGIGWNNGLDTGYNKYGTYTSFAKNTKLNKIPTSWAVLSVIETLQLTAMAAAGGAMVGTIGATGQSVRVSLVYWVLQNLPSV